MNFLPAILTNTGTAAQLDAGPLLQFVDGRRNASDGKALTIGIRPEHIRINPSGLSFRVDLVEPLGSETLVHGRLAAPGEAALVMRLAGRAPESDLLSIEIPPEDIHVFDAATGLRLP
jgi:sn-glycerol 3-phosphate transport system ATP-binding protein